MTQEELEETVVLGHICDGLIHFKEEDRSCVLGIDKEGHIYSCDTDSSISIKFCPFCGESLKTLEK